MKEKFLDILEDICPLKDNKSLKIKLSIFITACIFFLFSLRIDNYSDLQHNIFVYLSGITFAIWICITQDNDSALQYVYGFFRLSLFFFIFISSLKFCIYLYVGYHGLRLIIYSLLASIGIFYSVLYLVVKFIDIYKFIIMIFNKLKKIIFTSIETKASKTRILIENITAFLVSITGLGLAIKSIIIPIISFFQK